MSTPAGLNAEAANTEKRKNTDKRARNFDFAEMVALSIKGVKQRDAEAVATSKDARNADSVVTDMPSSSNFIENIRSAIDAVHASSDDDEDVGPILPPGFLEKQAQKTNNATIDDDDNDEGYLEDEPDIKASSLIPAACELSIGGGCGAKPVTALSFDLQGTKFATGGYDYAVKLYDFLKMDKSMKSFREVHPCESHVINDIVYNANGETLLIASGNCQLKLLDRQGKQWAETIRGDQYLVDLSLTKGHTAAVNACVWNPLSKTEFLTCSDDGSLRIWDTGDFKVLTKCINTQRKVIKTKNASGKRSIPVICCYSADGKLIAAGCDDGSIQIWKNAKIFVNTAYLNRKAHSAPITGLSFSPDGKRILSRSLDDTLKLFDLTNFKKSLREVKGLGNLFHQTDCGYSPHAEFVYTSTSERTRDGICGSLQFFDAQTLELLYKISYPKQGCIRVRWQPKINQILVGLSDGSCRLYYDPSSSVRGAKLCADRPVKRVRTSEIVREELILSPLTLEMFQPRGEEGEEKEVTEWRLKKFLRMQSNSKRPQFRKPAEMPMSGPSAGGRLAQSGGTLHSFVAQQLGKSRNKDFLAEADIRASILRHADAAKNDPIYVGKAYAKTQPEAIFQDTFKEENEEENEPVFKASKIG